jgi:hypothetical protein
MTRRLSVLIATCALGLGVLGGTASADPPAGAGCKGEFTSGTAAGQGLDHAIEAIGPFGLSHEQFRDMRDEFCPDEEPF